MTVARPSSAVLAFDDVWKAYPDWTQRRRTLRESLGDRLTLRPGARRSRSWALREVSLSLRPGRSLGLIGHNGAGKSTLLRLASGLGRPTRGRIAVTPDTASVLHLGVSFDQSLTGRENAFTAALVAGFTRRQALAVLPSLLEFSGLEDFVDAPVRTYSDGMRLRLAFSVVAVSRPRLLVLDEVLAVGDLAFRRQCEDRIAELREDGTSLLLASHAGDEIRRACDDVLWLHKGSVRAHGEAGAVLDEYERATTEQTLRRTPVGAAGDEDGRVLGEDRFGSQEMVVRSLRVTAGSAGSAGSGRSTRVRSGDRVAFALELEAVSEALPDPIVSLQIRRRSDDMVVVDLSSAEAGLFRRQSVRRARAELVVDRLDLPAGDYQVDVGVYEAAWEHAYDYVWDAHELLVDGPSGGKGVVAPPARWTGRRLA